MSEENLELGSNDEGQSQTKKTDDVNVRLLEESKRNKAKANEYKTQLAELEEFKRLKLEEEGNFKTLLQQANDKLKAKDEESKALRQKTLKGNIVSTITRFANDVVDLEDLLNQPKFKSIIEEGLDEESLSLTDEAAEKYVKSVLEAKPHLRKPGAAITTHKNGKPVFIEKEAKVKSWAEMNAQEREAEKIRLMIEKTSPSKA